MLFTRSISGLTRILLNVDLKQYSQSFTQTRIKRDCKRLSSSSLQGDGQSEKKTFPERKLIKSKSLFC